MPGDGTDPCLHIAIVYATTIGIDLAARSDINSPRLLWSRDSGCYLAQLNVQTDDSVDYHFVAYLAGGGVLLDNYPGRKVPKMKTPERTRKQAPKVFKRLFQVLSKPHSAQSSSYDISLVANGYATYFGGYVLGAVSRPIDNEGGVFRA